MNDYLALLIVLAALGGLWLVTRLPVWRRCRCGTQFCTGCGSRRGR